VAIVPWFAAAVYDLIIGCEQFQDWKTHRQGLDWFSKISLMSTTLLD
jgi:hypothetical protein